MEYINQLYDQFNIALDQYDREAALSIIMDALEGQVLEISELYELILAPSLNKIASNNMEQVVPIWDEHIKTNIVRTILENVYQYIVKHKTTIHRKAMVLCLEEEHHDLGARMTADYLTLMGFFVYYIGANTPQKVAIDAIKNLEPDVVCISVTNYYHLTKLQKMILQLKDETLKKTPKLVIGGYAVHHTSNVKDLVHADYYLTTFKELQTVKEDVL